MSTTIQCVDYSISLKGGLLFNLILEHGVLARLVGAQPVRVAARGRRADSSLGAAGTGPRQWDCRF
jgi:hypothetical protein